MGAALSWGAPVGAQSGAAAGEWRAYAADKAGSKYSPLDQITKHNAADLRIAWRQSTIPDAVRDGNTMRPPRSSQNTPLMAGGLLYVSTGLGSIAALDAATGEVVWYDDQTGVESDALRGNVQRGNAVRGLAYWEDDAGGPADRDVRVIGVVGPYLVALNARTGERYPGFGDGGAVDLRRGYHGRAVEIFSWRSAPLVVNDVVIVGSYVHDFLSAVQPSTKAGLPGDVRGYDVRTGEQLWIFRTVPQEGEFGNDTWGTDPNEDQPSWEYSGHTNMWGSPSGDEELGYVYLPLSTPTNDYYGGHRPGDNLFAESIVCVDVETGRKVWHFQAVHHGLWDYDFPAGPNLLDVTVDGRPIQALAQVSKQGFLYAFDRVTGDPIWPIEERPVPTDSNIPGEVPAPTQPFPTRPAPFEYQGTSIDDLVDFTPEIRELAIQAVEGFRLGPLFTPPDRAVPGATRGTLFRPPGAGAASWSGAAVDPDTGLLYVPSTNHSTVIRFYSPEGQGGNLRFTHGAPEDVILAGDGGRDLPLMPQGLPLWKPPYTRLTAIDMNTGDHAWMIPTGDGDRIRNHPMLRDLDLPPVGGDASRSGPLLTKTLLIYALTAGGSDGGPRLAAYDKATGAEIASIDLPAGALGAPMTYLLDGAQHIALTVGGEVPGLIAFRLPASDASAGTEPAATEGNEPAATAGQGH